MSGEVAQWRSGEEEPARVVSVWKLMRWAVWTMVWPPAWRRLPEGRPAYGLLLPLMTVWGLVFGCLHLRLIAHGWPWGWWYHRDMWLLLANFGVGVPLAWLEGSLILMGCAWLMRQRITIHRSAMAIWPIWLTFALMPMWDLGHLALGWRGWTIAVPGAPWYEGFTIHLAWFIACPVLLLQTCGIARHVVRPQSFVRGMACAVGGFLLVRFVEEPLPAVFRHWLLRWDFRPEIWDAIAYTTLFRACVVGGLMMAVMRGWQGRRGWRWIAVSLAGYAVVLSVTLPFESERLRMLGKLWWHHTIVAEWRSGGVK